MHSVRNRMHLRRCSPLGAAPRVRCSPVPCGPSRCAAVPRKNTAGATGNGSASDGPKAAPTAKHRPQPARAPVTSSATVDAPASRGRPTKDQRLVSMRMIRQIHMKGARIGITRELAERLAGRPVSPGEVISVPVHLASSSPQSYLPASCNVVVRSLSGGAFDCHIKGLTHFLRSNGAVVDSSILLLVANPADPDNGYDSPSLTVRLANRSGDADNDFIFQAMHDYAVEFGAWISTQAEFSAYFKAQAKRLQAIASGGQVPAAVAPAPLRAPAKRSPLVAWAPAAGGKGQVEERLRMLPAGLPKVHVDAVQSFLEAPGEAKLVRTLPKRALANGTFNVPQPFAAAFNPHSEQGTKPPAVPVPVPVCYPHEAYMPLKAVTIRGSPRLRGNGRIEWESSGYRAWMKAVRAEQGDVLLLWAVGVDQEGWEAGRAAQVAVHLIRQAEVGEEALKAIVALVSG